MLGVLFVVKRQKYFVVFVLHGIVFRVMKKRMSLFGVSELS